jgi:hypothetical protein
VVLESAKSRAPPRLILEIDIRKLLAGAVLHDKGRTDVLDSPRRREAAGRIWELGRVAARPMPPMISAGSGMTIYGSGWIIPGAHLDMRKDEPGISWRGILICRFAFNGNSLAERQQQPK